MSNPDTSAPLLQRLAARDGAEKVTATLPYGLEIGLDVGDAVDSAFTTPLTTGNPSSETAAGRMTFSGVNGYRGGPRWQQ
jgi:hypothetical protein